MGLAFFDTIMTGVAHMLKLLDMQPSFSNKLIFSLTDFRYFNRIGYDLHAVGSPVAVMSSLKRFVLHTSIGDFETMLL